MGAMMAVATTAARRREIKQFTYQWEGVDRNNRMMRGEMRAASTTVVTSNLRRQGIRPIRVKQLRLRGGGRVTEKDITLFTRQLATMMRAGVPLLQSFDIVARGHSNPRVSKLLLDIKNDIETGSSLNQAFRKHPRQFDALYCNLIAAGESAGVLEVVLERLAQYKEKILAIKSKIKSAMFYPAAIIVVAVVVVTIIMLFVIPAFKQVFTSFGADLPAPTLIVIAISDFFVTYWYLMALVVAGIIATPIILWRRSTKFRMIFDRMILRFPVLGDVIRKATLARWSRTLATMFAAGVPLVEAMDSVAGAAGNYVYYDATKKIQSEIATGVSLTASLQNRGNVFPNMVIQMTQIGEESGSLDTMLSKVADFYEQEVDDAVAALSSLLEPIMMVLLGVIIGGLVIAMYLPIFKLGSVV